MYYFDLSNCEMPTFSGGAFIFEVEDREVEKMEPVVDGTAACRVPREP